MIKVRAIIAGSRNIICPATVHLAVSKAVQANNWDIIEIVSGCARGVDTLGEKLAAQHGRKIRRFPADWHMYGPIAGPIRNNQMATYADVLILVWDGVSPGSANMKQTMEKLGKPVYEYIVTS